MAERPRKRVRTSPPPSATSGVAAEPTSRHEESSDATSGIHGRADDDAGPLARYSIPPTSHYASDRRTPTAFQQPLPLTSFSYSPRRELLTQPHERDASLSYYRDPQPGADLNVGYEEAVWRDGTVDEGLDALLESCVPIPIELASFLSADQSAFQLVDSTSGRESTTLRPMGTRSRALPPRPRETCSPRPA